MELGRSAMKAAQPDPAPAGTAEAVPLVLAVVGHRDPIVTELPRLRAAFREDLEALLAALPHTPLLMLNGLACGMDSDAAEVFLDVIAQDRRSRPMGPRHQLVAALPKSLASYRHDFRGQEERLRFESLLARCDGRLDPSNCSELRGAAPLGEELGSPECYGQQGVFLVRACYLLFAFHNGFETMEIGGTAQSVAMQKGDVHPLFLTVDEVIAAREPGALIEYDTPRHKTRFDGLRQARAYWLESRSCQQVAPHHPLALHDLLTVPRRLEAINRVLQPEPGPTRQEEEGATALKRYVKAEAARCKRRFLIGSLLMILAGVLITLVLSQQTWQLLGLVLIVVALRWFPRLQRGPKHRFIVYRCLAESLTVQDHWAALGIEADVADLFHSQTHPDLEWIRTVLRARRVQLLVQQSQTPLNQERMAQLARAWMADQCSWMAGRIEAQGRVDQTILRLAVLLMVAALLSLLVAARLPIPPGGGPWLSALAEILIAGFAASLAWRELLGYEEINARYARSVEQFRRGLKAFEQALHTHPREPNRLRRLHCALEAVGREKLDELNDWVADQLKRTYRPGT